MDKITPSIQATPVTTKVAETVSQWYVTESTLAEMTSSEVSWMHAQGWATTSVVTAGGISTYAMSRRRIKPESVLDDLVASYTSAYNDGRTLNDQRYDDIVTLYTAVLDKTEDSFNALETDDDTYEALVETIFTSISSDFSSYDTDVDGDLDDWGTDLLAEINARFNARSSAAAQELVDRGLYSSTMWTTISAGVERERTRALNDANDKIEMRQLELKHKIYEEQKALRTKLLAARDRLRVFLRDAKDRQVSVRNAVVGALAGIIERRTDGYPDLGEIGRLAASLGAGSSESYSP